MECPVQILPSHPILSLPFPQICGAAYFHGLKKRGEIRVRYILASPSLTEIDILEFELTDREREKRSNVSCLVSALLAIQIRFGFQFSFSCLVFLRKSNYFVLRRRRFFSSLACKRKRRRKEL